MDRHDHYTLPVVCKMPTLWRLPETLEASRMWWTTQTAARCGISTRINRWRSRIAGRRWRLARNDSTGKNRRVEGDHRSAERPYEIAQLIFEYPEVRQLVKD